ncbi:protein Dr1 [Rhopalosiphum padi]|uniref:protein Dr1 n=1 Tax=Rhopalosiphum padi TaxID=40932 RepID=UPI00298E08BB|nr:protein Dr1 [Rhopalosiphum padi]XP_060834858.1 protein Dr1 [Rhopalosiphum padi]
MSMIQSSNNMSDNDRLIPSCSTSNPIPSSNITDSNPNHSKTTQISNCNTSSINDGCGNPGPSNEDEELTLPRASVNKMIKDALPNIRVANEVREMIMNCCTEFIHLVSSEANQVCMAQQKKTINGEHLLTALDHLGFGDYRAEAEEVGRDCQSKRRRQSTRLENLGIPEEELLRQQQELFAKAREEQMAQEQQQWQELQAAAQRAAIKPKTEESSDEDDYS